MNLHFIKWDILYIIKYNNYIHITMRTNFMMTKICTNKQSTINNHQ